jgi:hypothetical protein
MALNYSIIDLPGRSQIKVAVVDQTTPDRGVKSPEWMLRLDDILFSYVQGYEDCCELFGWYAESNRFTSADVSNELFTSATLKHSDIIVIIPNGGYGSVLQTCMNSGNIIESMSIVRLGNVGNMKVKLQEIAFDICRVQSFQQQLDRINLNIQVTTKTDTHYIYDVTGQIKGQMVTSVNYSLAEVNPPD